MNNGIPESIELANRLVDSLEEIPDVNKVICPPHIALSEVKNVVTGTTVKLGAQNMHYAENGPFTGEISPSMLAGICEYVIIGHSERRQHFGEHNDFLNLKVRAACDVGLNPILCVGESLEQRNRDETASVLSSQIKMGLHDVHNIETLTIAYEPIWAIGTGVHATPQTAVDVIDNIIKPTLAELYGHDASNSVQILYGGSVSPENIGQFIRENSISGTLVGGGSLDATLFSKIARITSETKKYNYGL